MTNLCLRFKCGGCSTDSLEYSVILWGVVHHGIFDPSRRGCVDKSDTIKRRTGHLTGLEIRRVNCGELGIEDSVRLVLADAIMDSDIEL